MDISQLVSGLFIACICIIIGVLIGIKMSEPEKSDVVIHTPKDDYDDLPLDEKILMIARMVLSENDDG